MIAVELLIPISLFAACFGVIYVFLITRNRERMAMIERGADPNLFAKKTNRIGLKIGLLACGVALGVVAGQILTHTTKLIEPAAMISMIFLFAGMGLIADYYLAKREMDKSEKA